MLHLLPFISAVAFGQGHDDWQSVLDNYRSSTARVNYEKIGHDGAVDSYVNSLAARPEPATRPEKLAFWINAYNAITVKLVADNWPIKSIRDLDNGQVWDSRTFTVANQTLTLNQIERQKLIPMEEPRVHVALNCASLGCPPLYKDAFLGRIIEQQLHEVSVSWISTAGIEIDPASKQLRMSVIFDWYASDFNVSDGLTLSRVKSKHQGPVKWVSQYTPQKQKEWLLHGNYTISFMPYSWAVNAPD
jgi:hypothetical protein